MTDVRIGVLGSGRIAQSAHLPAIAKAHGAVLGGVFDRSDLLRGRVSQRYGTRAYSSVEEMVTDPEIDAVIVAVPDRFHFELASLTLRSGKHVLVEKPLTANVTEAESLARLVSETGLVLQVGAMKRHDPGVRFAAEAVRSRIGRILSASIWYRVMAGLRSDIEATHFPPMIVDDDVKAQEATFKADRANYLLVTHGVHVLDGMHYLLGDLRDISARRTNVDKDYCWHGFATLADDGIAHFEISANVHGEWSEGAAIFGEFGTVKLRTHFPVTLQASDVEVFDEFTGLVERPIFADSSAYKLQIEAFVRSITNGEPASPDVQDGLLAVRLIEAVNESLTAEGARVSL